MRKPARRATRYAPLTLFLLTLTACPKNPATGERQLILISEGTEIKLGREGAQQVEASIGLYDDEELQAYVSRVGKKLAAGSERPDLPWSFKVVDDPIVNAFALPGGFIFMTRGILTHFTSEAEMAAVLGHEIGHVTARHSAEQLSRAQAAQLGLGIGSVLSPEVAQFQNLIGTGLGLLFLKFGRDDERQADDLGFRYMGRGSYDRREMVDVFELLGRVSEAAGGSRLPSWLSTHPDPGERVERIRAALAEAGNPVEGTAGRDRYLGRIKGVVFGENPRNGFFREGTFLHPDLAFQLVFPAEWQTQNTPRAVMALSPGEDALIQLTLAEGKTADEARRAFLAPAGIATESSFNENVNGLAGRWAYFSASTQQGTLAGIALFVTHKNQIFQILAYTPASRLRSYESTFLSALRSFAEIKDRQILNIQPRRIDLVRINKAMTIEEFAAAHPSTIPVEQLAIINGVAEGERIPGGTTLKRVIGGPG